MNTSFRIVGLAWLVLICAVWLIPGIRPALASFRRQRLRLDTSGGEPIYPLYAGALIAVVTVFGGAGVTLVNRQLNGACIGLAIVCGGVLAIRLFFVQPRRLAVACTRWCHGC